MKAALRKHQMNKVISGTNGIRRHRFVLKNEQVDGAEKALDAFKPKPPMN